MATWKYAAKDPGGRTVEGTIDAVDRGGAVAELRRKNLVVLKLDEAGAFARRGAGSRFQLFKPKASATSAELVIFTRQLSTMVASGLALLESLEVLAEQAQTPGMKATCETLVAEVRAGNDLSAAMERCPKAFDHLYISMVRAGEVSGQMDVILDRLAQYQEESQQLQREIKSAMAYPAISLCLVVGITLFLMLFIVPGFRQMYDSWDEELPAVTTFVLGVSESLRDNWALWFGAGALLVAGFVGWKRTRQGTRAWDAFVLKAPVFGPLLSKLALARFSKTFATLVRSGVPIMATLDIVAATSGNSTVEKAVLDSRESVRSGNLLSDPLSRSSVFPPMVVRMIAIGERTGSLDSLLEKIAEFYDQQVRASVKALTSLIEPILITVMGVIVGGVVLAVFLPILDMVSKLGSK
jgi:type IV pilus assembly protein PilC